VVGHVGQGNGDILLITGCASQVYDESMMIGAVDRGADNRAPARGPTSHGSEVVVEGKVDGKAPLSAATSALDPGRSSKGQINRKCSLNVLGAQQAEIASTRWTHPKVVDVFFRIKSCRISNISAGIVRPD